MSLEPLFVMFLLYEQFLFPPYANHGAGILTNISPMKICQFCKFTSTMEYLGYLWVSNKGWPGVEVYFGMYRVGSCTDTHSVQLVNITPRTHTYGALDSDDYGFCSQKTTI